MTKHARLVGLISIGVTAALTMAGCGAAPENTTPSTTTAASRTTNGIVANGTATNANAVDANTASTAAPVVPRLPAGSRVTGHVAGSALLHLSVNLKPRDAKALQAFVTAVSTPGSPRYHHYLAKGRFAAQFGPTRQTLAHVEAVLRGAGLTVGKPTADGLALPVTATAAQAARVFGTGFNSVKLADGTSGYANTKAPVLPASIRGVVSGVSGLTSVNRMRPHHQNTGRHAVVAAHSMGSGTVGAHAAAGATTYCSGMTGAFSQWGVSDTNGFYSPGSLASVYGMSTGSTAGAGQTVAVFELESVDTQSVADYQNCIGTKVPVSVVPVGNAAQNTPADGVNVGIESALDIEDLAGLLPGATQILDYQGNDRNNSSGNNELDVFRQMVSDDKASVISTSWGLCETYQDPNYITAENTVFAMAAAQGQTVVAASGDSGSSDCYDISGKSGSTSLAVDDPASQPYVTGVGGTWMKGSGGTLSQGVWNRVYNGANTGAGGGGVSSKWIAPAYQGGFSGRGARTVPDVSALADPFTGYPIVLRQNGSDTVTIEGGTSAAAPTWAALVAQANTSSTCQANARQAGFVSPALYDAARNNYGAGFYDITSGSNALAGLQSSGSFASGTGYDPASGLGTPKLAGLIGSMCAPRGTAATGAGTYHQLALPARLLDTAGGIGWGANGAQRAALPAYGIAPVKISGRGGVPTSGVTSVTVNVQVDSTNGGSGGLTVYPDGSGRNGVYPIYWNAANGHRTGVMTVPVPADGVIDFYTINSVNLKVDVEGYWTADTNGASYVGAANPLLVLNTYSKVGTTVSGRVTNTALTFKVNGGAAPAGVQAVALNLVAFDSVGSGTLRAGNGTAPGSVHVTWSPGTGFIGNLVYVPVSASGTVTVWVSGTTQLFAEVEGWFAPGAGATFQPLMPGQAPRVLNTTTGVGAPKAPVQGGKSVTFQVSGGSLPVPAGAKFVLLDLNALNTAANGSLVAYGGTAVPPFPTSYWLQGQTVGSAIVVPLSSTGTATVHVTATADLVADVQGWFS